MKKRKSVSSDLRVYAILFCIILSTFIIVPSVLAADLQIDTAKEAVAVNASAYWLYKQINTLSEWNALSSEQASWALLAFASNPDIVDLGKEALLKKAYATEEKTCWSTSSTAPASASSCYVKPTAIASIAIYNLGEDTYATTATDWILAREKPYTTTGVRWLLQIDSQETTNCTVSYDSTNDRVDINKDKTYTLVRSGECLSTSANKYQLSINNNCLNKQFSISCNKAIIASMPYVLVSGEFFVPAESFRSSGQGDTIDMKIKTLCLAKTEDGTSCDYESTLWAAYALSMTGRTDEYSPFIPYLVEKYSDLANKPIFPEPILYGLTPKEEFLKNIISAQKTVGYFERGGTGSNGRFYDTAIAIMAVDGDPEIKAKKWLISNQSTTGDRWGTDKIRDTAMLLYYGWPGYNLQLPLTDIGTGFSECQDDYSFFCRTRCITNEVRTNYSCNSGQICCRPKDLPENECEDTFTFSCRESCGTGEEETNISCLSGICCKPAGYTAKCTTNVDCKKRDCKGQYILTEDSSGVCEYPSETTCDDGFDNDGDGDIDFDDNDCTERCSDKGGEICSGSNVCSGDTVKSFDSDSCCIGTCSPMSGGTTGGDKTCAELNGFVCADNKCDSTNWLGASDTSFCCSQECKSGNMIWWIMLIIILLGGASFFLYKKGYFDKLKAKFKPKTPPPKPGMQMKVYMPQVRPLQPQPSQYAQTPARTTMRKEMKSELDETMTALKKLAGK